jgi:hypothetical protein
MVVSGLVVLELAVLEKLEFHMCSDTAAANSLFCSN